MDTQLASQLNCPICLHIPQKEIYQCKNGHTICAKCAAKVSQCPQCRTKYGTEKIRCRAMESLLDSMKFDCPNEPSGCTQAKMARGDISQHLTTCTFGFRGRGDGEDNEEEAQRQDSDSDEDDDDDADASVPNTGSSFIVRNLSGLRPLGDTEPLASTSTTYKNLAKYIRNGSDLPPTGLELKIHNIATFEPETSCARSSRSGANANSVLLWFKTTPRSVSKLALHQNGCISFFDRIARAVATNPKEIRHPLRQMVLLFSVTLGREYNSPQKYQHWRSRNLPQGFDSVKTEGKFIPDSGTSAEDNSTKIPLGKTKVNDASSSYDADYNEYIIYQISKAKLRYAVDIEFKPCVGAPPRNEDDDEEEDEEDEETSESDREEVVVDSDESAEEDEPVVVRSVPRALELVEDSGPEVSDSEDESD